MNSVPCATSRLRKAIHGVALLASFATSTAVDAVEPPPSWWSLGISPPVSGTPKGLAVANLGQAKYMAKCALDALNRIDPAVGQAIEADLVGVDKPIPSWDPPVAGSAAVQTQYAPLLIGQLKAIADPFYRQLNIAAPLWLTHQRSVNQTQDPADSTFVFPWTSSATDDSNKAIASVGQLKAVFALRFDEDSDANSLPDVWEYGYLGHLGNSGSADADGDGLTNLQEAQAATDPTSTDSDHDGMSDFWEILHHLNPNDPADAVLDMDADGISNLEEFLAGTEPETANTPLPGPAIESFSYDQADRLNAVASPAPATIGLDQEGNILNIH